MLLHAVRVEVHKARASTWLHLSSDAAGARMAVTHKGPFCTAMCAQGKFYPFRDTFRRFHLMTVPLSPARAALLLGGAAKHMGYDTYQVRGTVTPNPDNPKPLGIP